LQNEKILVSTMYCYQTTFGWQQSGVKRKKLTIAEYEEKIESQIPLS